MSLFKNKTGLGRETRLIFKAPEATGACRGVVQREAGRRGVGREGSWSGE